jgi:hypothetical protein
MKEIGTTDESTREKWNGTFLAPCVFIIRFAPPGSFPNFIFGWFFELEAIQRLILAIVVSIFHVYRLIL